MNAIKPIFRSYKVDRNKPKGIPGAKKKKGIVLPKPDPKALPIVKVKKKRNRSKKSVTRCPHTNMRHYAKGMCNHCYHLYGRSSLATDCPHKEKMIYAKGLCQNCYFNRYNKKKRSNK